MEESKEIANLLGIPIIESIEEADPQCAWLKWISLCNSI